MFGYILDIKQAFFCYKNIFFQKVAILDFLQRG